MSDTSRSFVATVIGAPLSGSALRELTCATLGRGKPFRFTAHGYSMAPFIQDGDVLTVAPFSAPPRLGAVVAFVHPQSQRLTVHRIVAITPAGYQAQGDNCSESDGVVTDADLLGQVVRVERNGRTVGGGLGAAGAAIAHLSRHRLLLALRQALTLPRRLAGAWLRRLQGLALYRSLCRRRQPALTISEATAAEMAVVQRRLTPGVWRPPPRPDPRVTHYVARAGGALAGYVELVRHPPEHAPYVGHWLFSLHVWTRYRGLGIGERLTRQVMAQAQAEGAPALWLVVNAANQPALRLYRKLGFAPVEIPGLSQRLAAETPPRIVMRALLQERAALAPRPLPHLEES